MCQFFSLHFVATFSHNFAGARSVGPADRREHGASQIVATAFHPACDLTESLGLRSLTASEFAADFLNRNIHDFGARNPLAGAAHFMSEKK
jgi:hypothetical protein